MSGFDAAWTIAHTCPLGKVRFRRRVGSRGGADQANRQSPVSLAQTDKPDEASEIAAGGYPTCPSAERAAISTRTEVLRRLQWPDFASFEPSPLFLRAQSDALAPMVLSISSNGPLCKGPHLLAPLRRGGLLSPSAAYFFFAPPTSRAVVSGSFG